jgi:hypothetical protein
MMGTLAVACGSADSAFRTEGQGGSSTTTSTPTTRATVTTTVPATSTTTSHITAPTTSTTLPAGAGSGVKGTVLFSPVCPVERIPPDPQCAPRPGAADIQLVRPNGSLAAQGRAGLDGQFSIVVTPGPYAVQATAPAPGPGRGCQVEPAEVTVVAGAVATVVVRCDTGIR